MKPLAFISVAVAVGITGAVLLSRTTPDTHLLDIENDASNQVTTVTIRGSGTFNVRGSHDLSNWVTIEANWDTQVYGHSLLIHHQNEGAGFIHAK